LEHERLSFRAVHFDPQDLGYTQLSIEADPATFASSLLVPQMKMRKPSGSFVRKSG
jgi:hypothetical protein